MKTTAYQKYLRWHDKVSKAIADGRSKHQHPLTMAKWRKATRNKQPLPKFIS